MTRVYIDGSAGTTGLRIARRLSDRDDIELLSIDPEYRKDPLRRADMIHASDITCLCLPDAAAREAVGLAGEDPHVKIIDASTAHRTKAGWTYGFPELIRGQRDKIRTSRRVAVPGCHASGTLALIVPLREAGLMHPDYPVSVFSLTGYSGGGKSMIADYEKEGRPADLDAPRLYGLSQQHKHLPEIRHYAGLYQEPVFSPIVDDFYSGMLVSVPLFTNLLDFCPSVRDLWMVYHDYYANEPLISVLEPDDPVIGSGFISAGTLSGKDSMQIMVTGNDDRIVVSARFDNLGKGASGAAVQCLNLMTGCEETKGLVL